jgi:hypothetical protein
MLVYTDVCFTFGNSGIQYSSASLSYRIVIVVGEILAIVVFVAYSATLVSIFSTPPKTISSISDLLQTQLKIIIDTNNAGAKLAVSKVMQELCWKKHIR